MATFPDNRHFAYTIFDDIDLSTIENIGPICRLLEDVDNEESIGRDEGRAVKLPPGVDRD